MTTRRDVLAALLGLPFALHCKGRTPEPRFDGGFVTRATDEGHKLRDGFRPPPAANPARHVRVIVIGGGIAGLTAAWQLRRAGIEDVLVLELEHDVGGTSLAGKSAVSAYPWGAHYLPVPNASNRDLLELLRETKTLAGEVFDETQLCAAPKERVYFRGTWHEGLFPRAGADAQALAELASFEREVDALVARKMFALPIAGSAFDDAEAAKLDRISFGEWLAARKISSPLVRWLAEYGCRDDYGAEPDGVSAWYGLHYFASRKDAPGEESAEFLTWPEGNGFFVDHFARAIGRERLLCDLLVTSVEPNGAITAWHTVEKRTLAFTADRVVFAAPSFLRGLIGLPAVRVSDYAPWLVANIHLRGRPDSHGYPSSWDNVIYGSKSLGYVVATHQSPAERGRGPTVWTYYLPFTGENAREERRKLASLSWKEAVDAIVTELSSCHDGFVDQVSRIDVMRWGHGMVRPGVGAAYGRVSEAPVGVVCFAHTDLSGVALFEEAFFHGTRAAREVISALRGK